MIEKWVCDFANEDMNYKWEWVYKYNGKKVEVEWIFDLRINWNALNDFIWFISFWVRDIIEWRNHSSLIFSQWIVIADKNWKILKEREFERDLFVFKMRTGLSPSDEIFWEEYKKMSQWKKNQYYERYLKLEAIVEKTILLEREKMMSNLNKEKGIWGELDLF